ncbi:MAG: hypothetical protein M3256_23050 [Actinomycetota bacterium]|nr:hypothetical protein [Actinomycetota bacterium]
MVLVASLAGLAVMRAGSFGEKLETNQLTDEAKDGLQAFDRAVGQTLTRLLSFLVDKSDEDVRERHDQWLNLTTQEMLAITRVSPSLVLDELADAIKADQNFDSERAARFDRIVSETKKSNLSPKQKARILLKRSIDFAGRNATKRALELLTGSPGEVSTILREGQGKKSQDRIRQGHHDDLEKG